jgi:glutathione S-transferase
MELWYAPTSPFARKVRVVAHELGLADQLRLVEVDPWTDTRLRALNPLAKVPTLVLDDGETVWESGLIAERLEEIAGGRALFPGIGPERWRALSLQALADGAATAAGRLFADENRRAGQRSETMLTRFRHAIDASLDRLETCELLSCPTIGEISVAVLLGYLHFRWPGRPWIADRRRLNAWYGVFAERASMLETPYRPMGGRLAP